MNRNRFAAIEKLLASSNTDELLRGLELVREQIPGADGERCAALYELLATLLYIDPLDRPDLMPVLEGAIGLVAELGECVIPTLVVTLEAGDVKAELAVAQALGRMGRIAIDPLLAEYHQPPDANARTFILYALSKIKLPEIVRAVPVAIEAAGSTDQELRDTATRSLGKFVEVIPPSSLTAVQRDQIFQVLQANLADQNPVVRAKAVRSLGKLARFGHLNQEQRSELAATLDHLLGEDEHFEWDRAYIVRREAKEAREGF